MARFHDDLDDGRTAIARAKAKAAETWQPEQPADAPVSRRPQPMTNRRRVDTGPLAAVAVLGLFAAILAVSIFGGGSTPVSVPQAAPTGAPAASPVVPAPESAPALSAPQEPAQRVVAPAPEAGIGAIDCATTADAAEQAACRVTGSAQQAPVAPPAYAAPAAPVAAPAPAELTPLGCIRVYVTEHAYNTVNADGSTCYESATVIGADGSAAELTTDGSVLREEPARAPEPTPAATRRQLCPVNGRIQPCQVTP